MHPLQNPVDYIREDRDEGSGQLLDNSPGLPIVSELWVIRRVVASICVKCRFPVRPFAPGSCGESPAGA